jgi:hypothetical protein
VNDENIKTIVTIYAAVVATSALGRGERSWGKRIFLEAIGLGPIVERRD